MEGKRFALVGAAGFVAPRHLSAIKHVGGELVAAVDPNDSVGVLDSYFPQCEFFTSPERFDRFLNRSDSRVDYVVVCSPNWLHDTHCRWALRAGADVICEKPLALRPWNVDQLSDLEASTGKRVYPILQLRCHPEIVELRRRVQEQCEALDLDVVYTTRRGPWYLRSWKGDEEQSGGILMNLGVHLFDALCFIYGSKPRATRAVVSRETALGEMKFGDRTASWRLSIREDDLPSGVAASGGHAKRTITVVSTGEVAADFSHGFTSLHTDVYERIAGGTWYTAQDAWMGIDLVRRSYKIAERVGVIL